MIQLPITENMHQFHIELIAKIVDITPAIVNFEIAHTLAPESSAFSGAGLFTLNRIA
mgnify:CR=1 FL=1